MTEHYKTEGIVFKGQNFLEADTIFSVFTKDFGRLEIFGKSIRKINSKLKSGIEIFSFSKIEFIQGKKKKTLTDALFVDKFRNIKNDPDKFEIAIKISNLVDNFIKGEEKDHKFFDLLNATFSKLNDDLLKSSDYQLIYYYFFWNFFSILGHGPELFKCSICGKGLNPNNLYFSNKDGGTVCKRCFSSSRGYSKINSDIVKILRLILKKEENTFYKLKIGENNLKSLKEISEGYLKFLLSIYSV